MKAQYIFLGIAATIIVCKTEIMAQGKSDPDIKRDMVLEKEYDPKAEIAGKIYSMPGLEGFRPGKSEIIFTTSVSSLSQTGNLTSIKADESKTRPEGEGQKGYIRLGGGNNLHFIGDGTFNLINTDKHFLDFSISHRSENRPAEATAWDNDNLLCLSYSTMRKNISFDASLSEEYYLWHYYAGLPSSASQSNSICSLQMPSSQWFSNTGLHFQLDSRQNDKTVSFGISIDENLFVLNQMYAPTSEIALPSGPTELESRINALVKININNDWQAKIDIDTRFFNIWNATNEHIVNNGCYADIPANNIWFEVVPQICYHWKLWSFSAGVHFSKLTGDVYKFRVAPELSASAPLWKNASLKLAINGGEHAYSYREGFQQNLYIDPTIRLLPEYIPVHVSAGIYWRPVEQFEIAPFAGYHLVKDMAMFYNARIYNGSDCVVPFELTNKSFSALYANANNLYAGLLASYNWCEKVKATADFKYNYWNASGINTSCLNEFESLLNANGGKVWYKPTLELNSRLDVSPIRNLYLSLIYQMQIERYAAAEAGDISCQKSQNENLAFTRLDDIHILDFETTYQINHTIGVFLNANNLLNRKTALWNRYELNGITLSGGVTLTF